MFAFSAKIAYGSLKISAKDENDFGQDEIDIMEKNEDGNSEKMKMTSSLKKMRMEIALFPTLRGGLLTTNGRYLVLPVEFFENFHVLRAGKSRSRWNVLRTWKIPFQKSRKLLQKHAKM